MTTHPRAKLGLAGRHELCKLIESRLADDGEEVVGSLVGGEPRGAPDARLPPRSLESTAPLAGDARRGRAGAGLRGSPPHWLGPRLIAGVVGRPHSTVHATLRRHRISRPSRPAREDAVRYEWPCPGDLPHVDTKRYARALSDRGTGRPGFATRPAPRSGPGGDTSSPTRSSTTTRASPTQSSIPTSAPRPSSPSSPSERGIRHLLIRPYRPQTNGKIERFQQTMAREWAYGLTYGCSADRARALPHWIDYYNERRPHSAIGERPPISRVHDDSGQDS